MGPDILVPGRLGCGSQAVYDVFLKFFPWKLSVTQSGRLMGGPTRAEAVFSNSSLGVTRCFSGLQGSPWYFNCEVNLSGAI